MNKANRKIIHVEFREPKDGQRHYYFGSKTAIYQRFSAEDVGITYYSLKNYCITKEQPYINKKCVIRVGELIAAEQRNSKTRQRRNKL